MHKIPQHVAIVMDGNGRWAERRGLPRVEGHRAGVETVKKIIQCCLENKIAALSLFAFSSENWSRPSQEVDFLMELFIGALKKEVAELTQNGIRLRFIGERARLSSDLQQHMAEAEKMTESNQQLELTIALNYGGKWDIVNAAKKLAQAVIDGDLALKSVDETLFSSFLDTRGCSEPDLFIRTSGELRISNFFLWQLAYTELYFTQVHWPDFDKREFEAALSAFGKRKRRFGDVISSD